MNNLEEIIFFIGLPFVLVTFAGILEALDKRFDLLARLGLLENEDND